MVLKHKVKDVIVHNHAHSESSTALYTLSSVVTDNNSNDFTQSPVVNSTVHHLHHVQPSQTSKDKQNCIDFNTHTSLSSQPQDTVDWEQQTVLPYMHETFQAFLKHAPSRWHAPAVQYKIFSLPVGGRLKYFYRQWASITRDPFILQCIKGIKIPVISKPFQHNLPLVLRLSRDEQRAVTKDVQSLLQQKVIRKVRAKQNQYTSSVFTIKKRSGGLRSILNLSKFNEWVAPPGKFKCDSMEVLLKLIHQRAWCCSVDVKSAFHHFPIFFPHRKYLTFIWQGQKYMYNAGSMGLALLPFTYTKVFKVFSAHLRDKFKVCISSFYDDSLTISSSRMEARSDLSHTILELFKFGFVPSFEKSILKPTQEIFHLGYIINTVTMTVRLDPNKTQIYHKVFEQAITNPRMSIRGLAKLIGIIISLQVVYPQARLHFRILERQKIKALQLSGGRWNSRVILSHASVQQLVGWKDRVTKVVRFLILPLPVVTISADASGQNWGCEVRGVTANGRFLAHQRACWSINDKEVYAIWCALKTFGPDYAGKPVLIYTDSTCALSCLRNFGSLSSVRRDNITQAIFQVANDLGITLSSAYVPSALNTADEPSRKFWAKHEYMVPDNIFKLILSYFPDLDYDMAATYQNCRLKSYCSLKRDMHSQDVDMFLQDWSNPAHNFYLFPPLTLANSCICFLERHGGTVTMLLPEFKHSSWWTKVHKLATHEPIRLPPFKLQMPWDPNYTHPLQQHKTGRLRFVLVRLSKKCSRDSTVLRN